MTTHKGLLNLVKTLTNIDNWQEDQRYVAALSLAWIGEQLFGVGGTLVSGRIAHFPEKSELVQENYREIAPQVVFFGARQWESLNRTVQAKIVDAHPLKRFFFTYPTTPTWVTGGFIVSIVLFGCAVSIGLSIFPPKLFSYYTSS